MLCTQSVVGKLYEFETLRAAAFVRVAFGDQRLEGSTDLHHSVLSTELLGPRRCEALRFKSSLYSCCYTSTSVARLETPRTSKRFSSGSEEFCGILCVHREALTIC